MASRLKLSDEDHGSTSRIYNLPAPVDVTEPVRLQELNNAALGLAWKDDVVAASTANINLSAPGTTIDGHTMSNGDRFLAKDQSTAAQSGIYLFNGAAVAATRAPDANTGASLTEAVVSVALGTANGGATYRQSATVTTIGTDTVTWTSFGSSPGSATTSTSGLVTLATQGEVNTGTDASKVVTPATLAGYTGYVRSYNTTFGDGAATTFTITHSLGKRTVGVTIYDAATYHEVDADVAHTTTNTITIVTATAPASNAYVVVVWG